MLLISALVSCSKQVNKPANPGGDTGGGEMPPPTTENYYVKMKMNGAAQKFFHRR